jgi:hypothetical protein
MAQLLFTGKFYGEKENEQGKNVVDCKKDKG